MNFIKNPKSKGRNWKINTFCVFFFSNPIQFPWRSHMGQAILVDGSRKIYKIIDESNSYWIS